MENFKLTGPSWDETLKSMKNYSSEEILRYGIQFRSPKVIQYVLNQYIFTWDEIHLALAHVSLLKTIDILNANGENTNEWIEIYDLLYSKHEELAKPINNY